MPICELSLWNQLHTCTQLYKMINVQTWLKQRAIGTFFETLLMSKCQSVSKMDTKVLFLLLKSFSKSLLMLQTKNRPFQIPCQCYKELCLFLYIFVLLFIDLSNAQSFVYECCWHKTTMETSHTHGSFLFKRVLNSVIFMITK